MVRRAKAAEPTLDVDTIQSIYPGFIKRFFTKNRIVGSTKVVETILFLVDQEYMHRQPFLGAIAKQAVADGYNDARQALVTELRTGVEWDFDVDVPKATEEMVDEHFPRI
jgi:hypothetical protein